MFKTGKGHERKMAYGGCTLSFRCVRYLFGSCPVHVRPSSVGVRWTPYRTILLPDMQRTKRRSSGLIPHAKRTQQTRNAQRRTSNAGEMVAHFQLVQPDDIRACRHFIREFSISLIFFLRSSENTWQQFQSPVAVSGGVVPGRG